MGQGLISITGAAAMMIILGVFGSPVAAHLVFTFDVLARYISVAGFFDRTEILIVIIWLSGVVTRLALLYHFAAIATASTLGIKSYRITLIPIAIATVILSQVVFGVYFNLTTFSLRSGRSTAPSSNW